MLEADHFSGLGLTIKVTALRDGVIEAHGHSPSDLYIDLCYLGLLGPSTTCLWRHLARLVADGGSCELVTTELAKTIGLGHRDGRNSPLNKTVRRLVHFDAGQWQDDVLAVRLALPDLCEKQMVRLAGTARAAHYRLCQMGALRAAAS